MVMAVRTPAEVLPEQYKQPFSASSAYTRARRVPTKIRPPTTVGWETMVLGGKPKAHLTLSLGTWSAVSPASSADWKRALARPAPQPFHCGPLLGSKSPGLCSHRPARVSFPSCPCSSFLPVTNSAMARRSSAVRLKPTNFIAPSSSASSTSCGPMSRRASNCGARTARPLLWHWAQCCWYRCSPLSCTPASGAAAQAEATPNRKLVSRAKPAIRCVPHFALNKRWLTAMFFPGIEFSSFTVLLIFCLSAQACGSRQAAGAPPQAGRLLPDGPAHVSVRLTPETRGYCPETRLLDPTFSCRPPRPPELRHGSKRRALLPPCEPVLARSNLFSQAPHVS